MHTVYIQLKGLFSFSKIFKAKRFTQSVMNCTTLMKKLHTSFFSVCLLYMYTKQKEKHPNPTVSQSAAVVFIINSCFQGVYNVAVNFFSWAEIWCTWSWLGAFFYLNTFPRNRFALWVKQVLLAFGFFNTIYAAVTRHKWIKDGVFSLWISLFFCVFTSDP